MLYKPVDQLRHVELCPNAVKGCIVVLSDPIVHVFWFAELCGSWVFQAHRLPLIAGWRGHPFDVLDGAELNVDPGQNNAAQGGHTTTAFLCYLRDLI